MTASVTIEVSDDRSHLRCIPSFTFRSQRDKLDIFSSGRDRA